MSFDDELEPEELPEDALEKHIREKYPETYQALIDELEAERQLFIQKQADYGSKNVSHNLDLSNRDERMAAFRGQIYRIHEKAERLFNVGVVNPTTSPQNESLEDSLKDLALISKIAMMVLKNKWGK